MALCLIRFLQKIPAVMRGFLAVAARTSVMRGPGLSRMGCMRTYGALSVSCLFCLYPPPLTHPGLSQILCLYTRRAGGTICVCRQGRRV